MFHVLGNQGKVEEKNTLYIFKFLAEGMEIEDGDTIKLRLERFGDNFRAVSDSFNLAIRGIEVR